MNPRSLRFFALALTMAASAATYAQTQVGRVLLAAGDAFALRNGQQIRLAYNSPIEFKDTLRTGAASSLQVRFNDESLLSLRESTDFAIEDYQFAAGDQNQERAFFRLIKGGFRSVTGLIGRARNANYRVQTQTATIGIRGTDYAARQCAGDCGANVKDGLYGSVLGMSSGTNQITVQNESTPQPVTFGINQHFYVADAKTAPQPLLQPPTFVSIRPQGKASAAQQGGSGSGTEASSAGSGAQAESRPSTVQDPIISTPVLPYLATEVLSTSGTPVVLPAADGFGVFYAFGNSFEGLFDDNNSTATFDGQNSLTSYKLGTGPGGSVGSGTITDTGSYTSSTGQVFTWGRWTGSTQITTKSGTSLTNVPLLFITGSDVQNGSDAKFIGGQGTYTFVGGPHPVDAGGNTGTVTSSSLGINFTTQSVSYSLGMSFPTIGSFGSATFSLSGSGSASTGSNTGEFHGSLSGSCSGGGCGSTSVSGGFDVGLAGPNGYDFAVVGGGVTNATQAGSIVFLNNYTVSSFTPGPAPSTNNPLNLTGQISYIGLPSNSGGTFALSTNLSTFSNNTDLVAFTSPNSSLVGSLGAGSIVDRGGPVTLVDGSTISWGRWVGNVTVTDSGMTGINTNSGLPFVVGPSGSIPTSGSFTYNVVGGVAGITSTSTGGSVTAGTANVTFGTTSSISLSGLAFSVGGVSFNNLGGSTTFSGGSIANLTISGNCTGGSCFTSAPASGFASGIFVGQQATGLALGGSVSGGGNTAVFGAALAR